MSDTGTIKVLAAVLGFVKNNVHKILGVCNLVIAILWTTSLVYVNRASDAQDAEDRKQAHNVYVGTHAAMITVFVFVVMTLFMHGDKK